MDLSHLKLKFIDEAELLLTNLDNVLILLEKDSKNPQYIGEAFRVMHTIKGASGMFGFEKIVEITHEIEGLYDLVRNNKLELNPLLLNITFAASDHIRALLVDEFAATEENAQQHQVIKKNIELLKAGTNSDIPMRHFRTFSNEDNSDRPATWNILFYPDDEIIKRCINIVYTFQDLFALGEYKITHQPFISNLDQFWSIFLITDKPYDDIESALMFIMDFCKIRKVADFNIFDSTSFEKRSQEIKEYEENLNIGSEEKTEGEKISQIQLGSLKGNNSSTTLAKKTTRINVDATKLDALMYLVSELVTTKSELIIALQSKNETKATDAAEKIEKLSKLFSENALSIRLVSLQDMLNRFKRLIRDLSNELGKKIEFVIIGEDTELDKNIIDVIGEPIMHIIRNNIDHGIENPEKRKERGKSESGTIKFEASKSGNYVTINISDDGNGIDHEFIYKKAVEKGFIKEGANLNKKEILDLIFLPGFSTAQSLTNVSGRGVGMDVVIKKIQEIRGEISIDSNPGTGTTFSIKIQQTVAIIDTLLIASGSTKYAIPIEDIESCGLEAHENIIDRQNNLIVYNNELTPFINLNEKFYSDETVREIEKIIIINKKNRRYAIIADSIIGEFQAVIKPLGETFKDIKFLAGASLLGDGSIAMLLDTDQLCHEITKVETKY